MSESTSYTVADRHHFMAGVRLFDAMLGRAEQLSRGSPQQADSVWIEGDLRGQPINPYLRPLVAELAGAPADVVAGFAMALGDYLGMRNHGLVPEEGPVYSAVTFERIADTSGHAALLAEANREEGSNDH